MADKSVTPGPVLNPSAEDLRDTPGLGHAAARRKGLFGIEHLADGADTLVVSIGQDTPREAAVRPRDPDRP
jgi:hypothetical protein